MNYYEILGLKKSASQKEIKSAYKNLVKKYHPDIYKGDKSFAQKKTAEINVAYETLSNPELKEAYDLELFPKVEYSYTPPTYTKTYDDYKSQYTSSHDSANDGSEHDYSTYANYSRPYTDYHRSKTPNSNYTYSDEFSEKIIDNVEKLSFVNKKRVFLFIMLFYLFLMISCIIQYQNFVKTTSSSSSSKPDNTTIVYPENTVENPNLQERYELYDYFEKEYIEQLYSDFITTNPEEDITFEEFENMLTNYINGDYNNIIEYYNYK